MRCNEINKHLADFVLEELPPEFQIVINEHLAVCEECRGEAGRVEATISGFNNSVRFKPSSSVYRRIQNQLPVKKPIPTRLLGFPRGMVYAFGAFLLGIVLTKSIDTFAAKNVEPLRIEVKQEPSRRGPFSDTVEFYAVPAKNLARI